MTITKRKNENPLGYRITDKVKPFNFGDTNYIVSVLLYDRYMYQNVNEFIGRYTFFFMHYMQSLDEKKKHLRIEEFLKDNNLNHEYLDDKIIKTTFTVRANNIYFKKGVKEGECSLVGIFFADNYKIFCTTSYMFFKDKFTNEQFMYSGGLI